MGSNSTQLGTALIESPCSLTHTVFLPPARSFVAARERRCTECPLLELPPVPLCVSATLLTTLAQPWRRYEVAASVEVNHAQNNFLDAFDDDGLDDDDYAAALAQWEVNPIVFLKHPMETRVTL